MTETYTPTAGLAAIEVDGLTRASFILRGALAAGAVYGTGALGRFVSTAVAAPGTSDIDILNFVLTLEYLHADFYTHKARMVGLSEEARRVAAAVGGEETEHVSALISAIRRGGGTPVGVPGFAFPVVHEASFLSLAAELETAGVAAYGAAVPWIANDVDAAAAGSIRKAEVQHAAAIARVGGRWISGHGASAQPGPRQPMLERAMLIRRSRRSNSGRVALGPGSTDARLDEDG